MKPILDSVALTPACAGYLGFEETRELKVFVRRAVLATDSLCRRLLAVRHTFSTAKRRVHKAKMHKIWDFLTVNPLTDAERALNLLVPLEHRFVYQLPQASWAITMYKLLQTHLQCFSNRRSGFDEAIFQNHTGEDWYRAFILANCANCLTNKEENRLKELRKMFLKNKDKLRVQNLKSVDAIYQLTTSPKLTLTQSI